MPCALRAELKNSNQWFLIFFFPLLIIDFIHKSQAGSLSVKETN